jgi:hypothetical protein
MVQQNSPIHTNLPLQTATTGSTGSLLNLQDLIALDQTGL